MENLSSDKVVNAFVSVHCVLARRTTDIRKIMLAIHIMGQFFAELNDGFPAYEHIFRKILPMR